MTTWRCGLCSSGPHAGPSRGYCKPRCAQLDRDFLTTGRHHKNERDIIKVWLALFDDSQKEAQDAPMS